MSGDVLALAALWLSLGLVLYVYALYPALLWLAAATRSREIARAPVQPRITLVVPAHNEAAVIGAKVRNSLTQAYPPDRLEIIVASDGSTDETCAVASAAGDARRVQVLDLPRLGKAHAINTAATQATGEILAFSDANIELAPDALARLAENFADPDVGGVCGNKRFVRRTAAGAVAGGENLYWRYEQWQKRLESRLGSAYAADGALHAVRRALFVPIREPAAADDMAISTRVPLQGRRLVFDERALALEEVADDPTAEFRRKIRVTNASLRALIDLGPALWRSGWYSVALVSHKLLRHLAPLFLIGALVANAVLAPERRWAAALLVVQLACYALAGAGHVLRRTRLGRVRLFTVPYYFCLVNLAALGGLLSLARGARFGIWVPRSGLQT